MAKPGRPTKLTPKVCKAIVGYVEEGNFLNTAAALAHVAPITAANWITHGRKERDRIEAGGEPDPNEARYLDFLELIDAARAKAEAEHVAVIRRCAAEGDRKASEFWLTHASDNWKPNVQKDGEMPDGLKGLVDILERARAERHG